MLDRGSSVLSDQCAAVVFASTTDTHVLVRLRYRNIDNFRYDIDNDIIAILLYDRRHHHRGETSASCLLGLQIITHVQRTKNDKKSQSFKKKCVAKLLFASLLVVTNGEFAT